MYVTLRNGAIPVDTAMAQAAEYRRAGVNRIDEHEVGLGLLGGICQKTLQIAVIADAHDSRDRTEYICVIQPHRWCSATASGTGMRAGAAMMAALPSRPSTVTVSVW